MRQLVASLAVVAGCVSGAAAQNPFPYVSSTPNPSLNGQFQRQPVLSPYLNLNNRGNPAVNFFNFVQPQMQMNQFGPQQGPPLGGGGLQPGDDINLDPQDPTSRIPRSSSHPSTFNNTGSFFNSLGTIGMGGGRPAPQTQAQMGRRR